MSETKLPRFLHELATQDKLPKGAYVDLPDKSQAWFVESVQKLADEVYTVNNRQDVLFTGFEPVVIYFNVRSFAEVMREILNHRFAELYKAATPTQKESKDFVGDLFEKAQLQIVSLRQRIERAYSSEAQKSNDLELWKFRLSAYQAYAIYNRRFDDVLSMSLSKLARGASEIGQQIEADAIKKGEAAYFWQKR